jgi:6-phosphogluconolactonase
MSGAVQRREVRIVADAAELTRVAAETVTAALTTLPAPPSILLSGGSTPRALFELLADPTEPYRQCIPWSAVRFFWGDERHVPPDDAESNYRMAREALLERVPVPEAHVHRIAGERADAGAAANLYERELIGAFHLRADRADGAAANLDWPRFSIVLLGLGEEGHTASLFPASPALDETRHLTAALWVKEHDTFRITVTPPVINHAARVVFLVSGASKAAALAAILEGPLQPTVYPAQIVAPTDGALLWLVDRAAAGLLRQS